VAARLWTRYGWSAIKNFDSQLFKKFRKFACFRLKLAALTQDFAVLQHCICNRGGERIGKGNLPPLLKFCAVRKIFVLENLGLFGAEKPLFAEIKK